MKIQKCVDIQFYFIGLFLLLWAFPLPAFAEEEEGRRCFGLIWCREEKEGEKSIDAFLYLYSSEERDGFSRLAVRPFYSHEIDESRDYIRRSILWPLGNYEKEQDALSVHVFPPYWQGEAPRRRYRLILPFYLDYAKDDRSYFHLFPFYGHHKKGESHDRYFIFGPLFIYTRDDLKQLRQWALVYPLFHHRSEEGKGRN